MGSQNNLFQDWQGNNARGNFAQDMEANAHRQKVGADDSVGPLSGCRDIVALVVGADAHIGPVE